MNRTLLHMAAVLLLTIMLTGCQCDHEWVEADCTTPGTCNKCGATDDVLPSHDWMDATCTTPKTCTRCGTTEGAPMSHQWQDASCEKAKNCSLCGAEEGEKRPHDYQRLNGYMKCSMCNTVDSSADVLPPLYLPYDEMTNEEVKAFVNLEGQNNLRNNARFHYQDGLYYGQYWDDAGNSMFVSTDMSSGTAMILDYGWAKNIGLSDGNIYYENIEPETKDHGIFRVNMKNGEYVSREKICDSYGSMQLKGDYIYYSDFSDQYLSVPGDEVQPGLYRCDLDGGNVERILDKTVEEFYVFDTGILYVDELDGETIHICYCDGSGDMKLNNQKSTAPIFDGEFIYYLSPTNVRGKEVNYYTCWKMRVDGSKNQQVSTERINNAFLIYNNYIYFCSAKTDSMLYRMKTDGSKPTLVTTTKNVYYVQILNGELKFTKYKGEYITGNYMCSLKGKNLRKILSDE